MAPSFNVRKMYSTVKRMDGCEYFIEIITVSLKDLIAAINYFENKLITAEKIIQTMDDCKFSCQNKYSTPQRIDDCRSFCDKNRYTTSRNEWL